MSKFPNILSGNTELKVYHDCVSLELTQDLISIDRCSRMVNKAVVFKGVPKVNISMSEPW